MSDLSITNVVNISVASPPAGLAEYQINNLAIFTRETQVNVLDVFTYRVYNNTTDVAADWGSTSEVYKMAANIFSQSLSILTGGGKLIVFPQGSSETLDAAIIRCSPLAFFGGILWAGYAPVEADLLAASATVASLKKLLFAPTHLATDVDNGEICDQLMLAGFKTTRSFLYMKGTASDARVACAAYASLSMSTNFEGSNTAGTGHLKGLVGVLPDSNMTQTIKEKADTHGADFYATVAGLPKVFSSSGNDFTDNVYNTIWLSFALAVAGFNALATTSTKIPQTEAGMSTLKSAYIDVLNKATRNGVSAAGSWNSVDVFGDPEDLRANVLANGWYIYSLPIVKQSQSVREARVAPVIQIACKLAGAIHSTSVIVYINK